VYVIGCPVQIAAGPPLCVTARSARAKTWDVVDAELLAVVASAVAEDTDELATIVPASEGAVTTIEIGAEDATPREAMVQVTGPVPEQAQPGRMVIFPSWLRHHVPYALHGSFNPD